MTSDAITKWLDAPAALPGTAAIDQALQQWPWFAPLRLMSIAAHQQHLPLSEKALGSLKLYGDGWLPAYLLLTQYAPETAEEAPAEEITYEEDELDPEDEYEEYELEEEAAAAQAEEPADDATPLIQPLYTEDYFRYEGIETVEEPQPEPAKPAQEEEPPQTLMVVMSFTEWLMHFKTKSQKEQEEAQEKSALRSMWQREKLAAALEDEGEEIPEDVFEMAVSSITKEDDIASESLAQIYEQQGKWGAAAEMYRKLALKYPTKSTYFASRAQAAKKRLL